MPQAVLDSPFGRMLQPHVTQMVEQRKAQRQGLLGLSGQGVPQNNTQSSLPKPKAPTASSVKTVTSLKELDTILEAAKASCVIVFFTSRTCGPCVQLYPLYDALAAEHGSKVTFVKVDTSQAFDVARRYSITATPTFVTFVRGSQAERWMGADAPRLRGTVSLLAQMATPSHPHRLLNLPNFQNSESKPVLYTRVPPLPKLLAKLGSKADDPSVQGVKNFIETRSAEGPAEATLPDLPAFSAFLCSMAKYVAEDGLFAVVDLFRCALVDPRFSGYFAEEHDHKTVMAVLDAVNKASDCPYPLRLVTLQMACNLFSSHLYVDEILGREPLRSAVTQLLSSSFLDDSHSNVRLAAASLMFNVASANCHKRAEAGDLLPESDQVELAASVLEAISQENDSYDALHRMLLALGFLAFCMPLEGELIDLLRSMDAQDTVLAKKKQFPEERLIDEVGKELLGKGLAKK